MVLFTKLVALLVAFALGVTAAPPKDVRYIVPGARWLDTDGNFISSHAGAVILNPQDG